MTWHFILMMWHSLIKKIQIKITKAGPASFFLFLFFFGVNWDFIKCKQEHTLKSLTTPQTSQPNQTNKDTHTNKTYINTKTAQNCNKIHKQSKLK